MPEEPPLIFTPARGVLLIEAENGSRMMVKLTGVTVNLTAVAEEREPCQDGMFTLFPGSTIVGYEVTMDAMSPGLTIWAGGDPFDEAAAISDQRGLEAPRWE